jgi:hypothetical protein
MASAKLIPRLDPARPLFSPVTPDFAGFAAQQLGDLGTGADGFDALFALPAANIDADIAALADLDTLLTAMDFVEGAFATAVLTPIDSALPSLLAAGDALLTAMEGW